MKDGSREYRRVHERDVESGVNDELEFHIAMRAESLRADGLDEVSARREAERRLGDMDTVMRECRREAERSWRRRRAGEVMMAGLRDVVHATRSLRRRPWFLLAACGTLALGIGATTAVYSMVDAVLLAPLPYGAPDRLVVMETVDSDGEQGGMARAAAQTLRSEGSAIGEVALYSMHRPIMSGVGEPEELSIGSVEHHLFEVLRAQPAIGTLFTPEHRPDGGDGRAVILSWSLWQNRFGGAESVIGETVDIGEKPHRILGVMPAGFEFPVGSDVVAWVPLTWQPLYERLHWTPAYHAIGRLAPGASLDAAAAEATTLVARTASAGRGAFGDPLVTDGRAWSAIVTPARTAMLVSDRALALMLAAVALLLLIACANVANLFLVRASERAGEFAVRAALGGRRADVVIPMVLEVMIVTLLAAGLGLALAHWAAAGLVRLDPGGLPRWDGIHVSGRAWIIATLATTLCATICALIPALAVSRIRAGAVLQSQAERSTGARGSLKFRDGIVALEVGLVFVLLVGAGLVLRSFSAVRQVDPGFELENVLTARVVLPLSRYPRATANNGVDATVQFYDQLLGTLRAHPAVIAAGGVSAAPLTDDGSTLGGELESPVTGETVTGARMRIVTPGYFAALGVPLRGRDFNADDRRGAPRVAIFNESMAARMFPGLDPIGRRFMAGNGEHEVVGVVGDIRGESPERPPIPEYYTAQSQLRFLPGSAIVVRTRGDAGDFAATLVATVRAIDPALPVASLSTMDANMMRILARRRFDLFMLGGIATTALILAGVGIFGVMSQAVAQRRREIGIRQACGARPADLISLILGRAFGITAVGILVSGGVAVVFALALRSMLFGIEPLDTTTFLTATGVVLLVALLAAGLPAWRAAETEPGAVLRGEY